MTVGLTERVRNRVKRMPRGQAFALSRFSDLGSAKAVSLVLSRMVSEGSLERFERGIFSRPEPLATAPGLMVSVSAEQVAKEWARVHGLALVPQGMMCANRVGFQTQMPVKTIYWTHRSTKKTKEIRVGSSCVQIQSVPKSWVVWPHTPEGELLRAMLAFQASSIEEAQLYEAFRRLQLDEHGQRRVIKKLMRASALRDDWRQRLREYEWARES